MHKTIIYSEVFYAEEWDKLDQFSPFTETKIHFSSLGRKKNVRQLLKKGRQHSKNIDDDPLSLLLFLTYFRMIFRTFSIRYNFFLSNKSWNPFISRTSTFFLLLMHLRLLHFFAFEAMICYNSNSFEISDKLSALRIFISKFTMKFIKTNLIRDFNARNLHRSQANVRQVTLCNHYVWS